MAQEKILAEETPNPDAIRVSVGRDLLSEDGWLEYERYEDAVNSPLAQRLLHFRFVKRVFIRKDFFTVIRDHAYDWEHIILDIREAVDRFLDSGLPASSDEPNIENSADLIEAELIGVLRGSIRGATGGDGGEMIFGGMSSGQLRVIPKGACRDCPFVKDTIEKGLEPAFRGKFSFIERIVWE